jgi:cold shock CspA family protein
MQGRIVRWKEDRGFGFIKPTDDKDGREVFVHISALPGGKPPPERALVEFDVEATPKGSKAVNISYLEMTLHAEAPARYGEALRD